MTILAIINAQTMVCENVSSDPRPASEIQIPDFIVLDLEQTQAVGWEWDESIKDYVMVDQNLGEGGIGDTYSNGKLVEPKPEPPVEQPVTTGTQDL